MNEIIRIYVDTSVFGGVFDNEFDLASQKFFDQVKRGTSNILSIITKSLYIMRSTH